MVVCTKSMSLISVIDKIYIKSPSSCISDLNNIIENLNFLKTRIKPSNLSYTLSVYQLISAKS